MGHTQFFEALEKELHNGMMLRRRDDGIVEPYRWRQERYKQWPSMGKRQVERSMEGWFKAEVALLLDKLQNNNVIASWDIEERAGGKRSRGGEIGDLLVRFNDGAVDLYLEQKCAYQGKQGKGSNTRYATRLNHVIHDMQKVIPTGAQLYCLLYLYQALDSNGIAKLQATLFNKRRAYTNANVICTWEKPYLSPFGSALSIVKLKVSPKLKPFAKHPVIHA